MTKSQEPAAPDYGLSQKAAAQVLCCAPKTVERYLNAGKLQPYGNFLRRKVSARSVSEFLAKGQSAEEIRDLAAKIESP